MKACEFFRLSIYKLSPRRRPGSDNIEAKDNNHSLGAGMQQALEYASILDIPCVFSSNGDGVKQRIREKWLTDCNVHTIIRLPNAVFAPYASVATNLCFFEKGAPTRETWYYEHRLPEGRKSYSKTKPIRIEEFDEEKAWWPKREESDVAWRVKIADIATRGYDLDIKNPHREDDEIQHSSAELLDMLEASLGAADTRKEREVEQALVDHVQKFLLELGAGFVFVGRQVLLEVGDRDFRLDLLFYHLKLRCYVVIELKAVPFDPGFTETLNLYLSAVDDLLRHPDDKPTIGLLLCKSKNDVVVEYALDGYRRPMGVARWESRLTKSLPDDLKGSLPSIEEIEAEFKEEEG